MPRRAPFDPTGTYHVGTRGNFGIPLFTTPGEHELYLELYERYATKFGWRTFAWALIWNHVHFLIQLTDGGLTEGMRAINHGFARRINAAYGRTGKGHVVRHSFFASHVTTDAYFAGVCGYIDLNAVEAGLAAAPEDWRWSGCAATLGLAPRRRFHDVRGQLRPSHTDRVGARDKYRALLLESVPGKGYESVTDCAA